jgi:hypothetical protein
MGPSDLRLARQDALLCSRPGLAWPGNQLDKQLDGIECKLAGELRSDVLIRLASERRSESRSNFHEV